MQPPKLYDRAIRDPVAEAVALARQYCVAEAPDGYAWTTFEDSSDPGHGLIELNARLIELVAERLNRVPEKNLLAFLDLVGVERAPGMAAEAPVTFLLSPRLDTGQLVPAGTRVATTQSEAADAQVFETQTAFFATPAKLVRTVSVFPAAGRFAVQVPIDLPPSPEKLAAAAAIPVLDERGDGHAAIEHTLFLASAALFSRGEPADITLRFTFEVGSATFSDRYLSWQRFDGGSKSWVGIDDVAYRAAASEQVDVIFPSFPGTAKAEVAGDIDSWVACRLTVPPETVKVLPRLVSVSGRAETAAPPNVQADVALFNDARLDLTKPARPFGERPRYGDAFYLGSMQAFAPDVGVVNLRFTLHPYDTAALSSIFGNLGDESTTVVTRLEWQYLAAGGLWTTITKVGHVLKVTRGNPIAFEQLAEDQRGSATVDQKNWTLFGTIGGDATINIRFSPEKDAVLGKLGGVEAYWIRAVVRSEHAYGRDGFVRITTSAAGVPSIRAVDPSFIAPVIEKIELEYDVATPPIRPDRLTTLNNFEFVRRDSSALSSRGLVPFVGFASQRTGGIALGSAPACYLGFDRAFGNAFISLFIALREAKDAAHLLPDLDNPRLVFEYLGPDLRWKSLDVEDGTGNLTSSGVVGFLAAATSPRLLFPELTDGTALHWYRIRQAGGSYATPPLLEMVLPNSVMAFNQETSATDTPLASGSGEPNQSVTILQRPVLAGDIWVRENEVPNALELAALLDESADQAPGGEVSLADVLDVREPGDVGEDRQVWVRWNRVPNFRISGPRSRHYTLEAPTGLVTFGGAGGGLIPPIGKDNIIVRGLRSGGGNAANRLATPLAIKEMKSSLPFIDKVFNLRGAVGGSDPWTLQQTYELGPQALKNRGRAVSSEDFSWLTISNFSEVARAKCLATRAPGADGTLLFKPGAVSIIIVPNDTSPMPQPTKGLLRRIEEFLRLNALGAIGADIHALAVVYRSVSIAARVHPRRPDEASAVARRVVLALDDFFHPLTGGEQHRGWPFGRHVYLSEVYAVIERTEGVDHVVEAGFVGEEPVIAENMLVASGVHQITMV
ncbi:putative baseplate assembly protein [Bradyrhizobium sp. HKCCYLS20291]|uniref:putative baseplate assembly protein n=1 Tax=Bradyrhizobium sp. HKCCYLS20291 TaxID=3420766 RepID=UPI003EB79168